MRGGGFLTNQNNTNVRDSGFTSSELGCFRHDCDVFRRVVIVVTAGHVVPSLLQCGRRCPSFRRRRRRRSASNRDRQITQDSQERLLQEGASDARTQGRGRRSSEREPESEIARATEADRTAVANLSRTNNVGKPKNRRIPRAQAVRARRDVEAARGALLCRNRQCKSRRCGKERW